MTKKIVNIGSAEKKIRNSGWKETRIDPDEIAAKLGAEKVSGADRPTGSPLALHALRAELFERLQSSGGRPALTGTARRVKIPITAEQWQQLEVVAATIATSDCTPSAGQVASVLLNLALNSVLTDMSAAQGAEPISTERFG